MVCLNNHELIPKTQTAGTENLKLADLSTTYMQIHRAITNTFMKKNQQYFFIIEKLQLNINSCTAKNLKAYGESWSVAHGCFLKVRGTQLFLEVCNLHFNVFLCFLLELSVEISNGKHRTKQINSLKYTYKLKPKRKEKALPENLNQQKLLGSWLNWTLVLLLLFSFTMKESFSFTISHNSRLVQFPSSVQACVQAVLCYALPSSR